MISGQNQDAVAEEERDVLIQDLRAKIIAKGGSSKTRVNDFTSEMPSDWCARSIVNPRTGLPYTDQSAWDLIIEILTKSSFVAINLVELNKPKGMKAIEILFDVHSAQPYLYIKVHMGRDKAVGRSFHYSTKGREAW